VKKFYLHPRAFEHYKGSENQRVKMKYILTLISYLLPTLALAQTTATTGAADAGQPGVESLVIQLGIIFVIFYFLLIRPQQKKFKAHTQMVQGLKKGDKVVTGGGFLGTITKADSEDKFVSVEIANGVEVKVLRSSVNELAADKKEEKK
jgi:preprotein translocase subunit YajC